MTQKRRGMNMVTASDLQMLAAEKSAQEDAVEDGGTQPAAPLASDEIWLTHVRLTVKTRRVLEFMKMQLGKTSISEVIEDAVAAYAEEQNLLGLEVDLESLLPMYSANKMRLQKSLRRSAGG